MFWIDVNWNQLGPCRSSLDLRLINTGRRSIGGFSILRQSAKYTGQPSLNKQVYYLIAAGLRCYVFSRPINKNVSLTSTDVKYAPLWAAKFMQKRARQLAHTSPPKSFSKQKQLFRPVSTLMHEQQLLISPPSTKFRAFCPCYYSMVKMHCKACAPSRRPIGPSNAQSERFRWAN